jgi:hypothetical protein
MTRRRFAIIALFLLTCGTVWPFPADQKIPLVVKGRSAYRIRLSREATESDTKAAGELRKYILEISGAELAIAYSGPADSAIWIGSAGHAPDFPLTVELEKLEQDGFRIKTDGARLLIAGGAGKGSLNGVYTFLESYLGCRKYSPDVEVIPKRRSITIGVIDDLQVPAVKFRMENFYEPGYAAWHKLDTRDEWGMFVHTFRSLIPPEKYFHDHPEYFSKGRSGRIPDAQLCLTNPDVLTVVTRELRERMREKPQARYWSVSQNDTFNPCVCDSCRAVDSSEGSPSGSLLSFVNRVADEFPDKIISTLAYQYSRSAPRTIKPRKNVNIMLCSIECNRSKPIGTDPASASFRKDVEDWGRLTTNILLWDYVIQFRNLVSPFPNLRVLQPNIRYFVKNGVTSIFEQGLGSMAGEFAELRTYLIAKLLWNPDINVDSVMNDFLGGYYGNAGSFLRQYIDRMHDALEKSGEDLLIYGYPLPSEKGYLSPVMMDAYTRIFDRAEKSVLKKPEFLRRVRIARLPLQFAILEQAKVYGTGKRGFFTRTRAGAWMPNPRMLSLLKTFVDGCRQAGIPRLEEGGTSPDDYLAMTQKFLDAGMKPHLALFKPVAVKPPASRKYHQGDARALTDGLKGWEDYHMHWLGFEGDDMEAVVDLLTPTAVESIRVDFLQDNNAWIFLPLGVEFALSLDGRDYRTVAKLGNDVPARKSGAFIALFAASFERQRVRYVRVRATNMKTCPDWHKGAGGLAWIFADEVMVF